MAAEDMWPNWWWASLMDSFLDAEFAVSCVEDYGDASTQYKPCKWGIFAMVWPFGFIIVHICLWNVTLWSALSSLLIDKRVKAISGVLGATGVRVDQDE